MAINWQNLFQGLGQTAAQLGDYFDEERKRKALEKAGNIYRLASQQPGMTKEDFLKLPDRQDKTPSLEFKQAIEHYANQFPTGQEQSTRRAIDENRQLGRVQQQQTAMRTKQGSMRTISRDIASQVIADIVESAKPKVDPASGEADYSEAIIQRLGVVSGDFVEAAQRYGYNLSEDEIEAGIKQVRATVVNNFKKPENPLRELSRVVAAGNRRAREEATKVGKEITLLRKEADLRDAGQGFVDSLQDFSSLSEAYDLEKWVETGKFPVAKYPNPTSVDISKRKPIILAQYEKFGKEALLKLNRVMDKAMEFEIIQGGEKRTMGPDDFPRELDQVSTTLIPYVSEKISSEGSMAVLAQLRFIDKDKMRNRIKQIVARVFPAQSNILDYLVDDVMRKLLSR